MTQVLRLLLAAACTALSAGLGGALLTIAPHIPPERVDDVVTLGVVALGLLVLAWYTLTGLVSCLVLLARVVAGGDWRAGEAWLRSTGAPVLRRLAMAGVAGSVSIGAVAPAWATTTPAAEPTAVAAEAAPSAPAEEDPAQDPAPEPPTAGHLPLDLGWPVSEPTTDPAPPPSAAGTGIAPAPPAGAPPTVPAAEEQADEPAAEPIAGPADEQAEPQPGTGHVVRRGESLWSIAAGALRASGLPAGEHDIAAAWPRLYEANADLVGPDPDLILPGQELHIPSFEEEQ